MSVVDVNSEEKIGEGVNGAASLVLDGDKATYWHTQWAGTMVKPPHHLTVKLSDEPVALGKVTLTPRQSSNGSGRVNEYELWTSADKDCTADSFTKAVSGNFPGNVADYALGRDIVLDQPTDATCAKVVYLSTWGGKAGDKEISPVETVGSLAEFQAYTASGDAGPMDPTDPPEPVEPQPTETITDGDLAVALHTDFPQVVGYELGGKSAHGNTGGAINSISVNGKAFPATSSKIRVNSEGTSASWDLGIADLDVTLKATASVTDGVLRIELSDLKDPAGNVGQISVPGMNLVTLDAVTKGANVASTTMSVDRTKTGDLFESVADAKAGNRYAWLVVPTTGDLSFGMENNAIADHTSKNAQPANGVNAKWVRTVAGSGADKTVTVSPGTFTWLSGAAAKYTPSIGHDENPWIEIKPTLDANSDNTLDWQDGATALRDLRHEAPGMEDVKDTVITRIPFNIVSQATHPFLRTLDDTKRVALATDGLGQQVMLKGYEAEGHDSAHPDYAGHYNTRAGGLKDLKTLVNEGEDWNATFGVHVNTTESYSESYNFSEELITMPPSAAWGWMNQSYYIDTQKDLATNRVIERFQEFRDEVPENLSWLYIDVYSPDGWQAKRIGSELEKQGWVIASEWADKIPDQNIWSHWANDENYGGQTNKGINSQIFRFVDNSRRDLFNPDPILGHSSTVEFEGWTGHNNYNAFIKNIWERNLPNKFLQQSDIRTWKTGEITFNNGTVATSPVTSIDGWSIPTNREITYDGATVYSQGKYLLPWADGDSKLYHYNPAGGETTWDLTDSWANQDSVTLFKLTDTGREKVSDLAVTNGSVALDAEAGVAYVLYPTSKVPAAQAPDWGQASGIVDPGFFSTNLDAYQTTGDVTVERSKRGNYQAQINAGEGSLSQKLAGGKLPAGKYNASAWVEIQQGKERDVALSITGDGVKAVSHQKSVNGTPTTTFSTTTAINATASDEKVGTYFQRARVVFETTGGEVTFTVGAGEGDAIVSVDDLRLTDFVPAEAGASEDDNVILHEDFENADTGYWPFVTGATNQGGDARTQLAEINAPYSQKGWYGKDQAGKVVQGGKILDNVLDGTWSLMAHEENEGRILRTTSGTLSLEAGHDYEFSFDYQNGYAGAYDMVIGYDSVNGTKAASTEVKRIPLGQVRDTERMTQTIKAGTCGTYFVAFDKMKAGPQTDLVIDNITVKDLGESAEQPACASAKITGPSDIRDGHTATYTTAVTVQEKEDVTALTQTLKAPEGWTILRQDAGESEVPAGGTATATWLVLPKKGDTAGELTLESTYKKLGSNAIFAVTSTKQVKILSTIGGGENYLSDLPFAKTPINGWGPVERDQANGEQGQNDGPKLSLKGVEYEKGLGTHANSRVEFDLYGQCTAFSALVGVDGKQKAGTVVFKVEDGNGKVLAAPTATMKPTMDPVALTADVTGVERLVLIVDNADGSNGNDWADWVNAKVDCVDGVSDRVSVTPSTSEVEQGTAFDIALAGFAPSAPVRIVGNDGADLGTVTMDEQGAGILAIAVAQDAPLGAFEFLALQDAASGTIGAAGSVTVTKAPVVEPEVGELTLLTTDFEHSKKPSLVAHSTVSGTGTVTVKQGNYSATAQFTAVAGEPVTVFLDKPLPSAGHFKVKVSLTPTKGGDVLTVDAKVKANPKGK
ncbi:endo-alpha-N-acetylgalactosaminidase family protein [Timonella senegalensis]|uniref:endo-alpha-N-acetylgalactosaminidase family protein n=1 Tax=Timonella senegalensis TaxID=1465825 RepID=UPI0002F056D5|nr:endo-alpha-N-acetylgalactosaminidase family protein [Timonella senegalensis]